MNTYMLIEFLGMCDESWCNGRITVPYVQVQSATWMYLYWFGKEIFQISNLALNSLSIRYGSFLVRSIPTLISAAMSPVNYAQV